jgi:hypothetical protein
MKTDFIGTTERHALFIIVDPAGPRNVGRGENNSRKRGEGGEGIV